MIWGETDEQRFRRLTTQTTPHRWFAWHPIYLPDGRMLWLQSVLRYRRIYSLEMPDWRQPYKHISYFWTYRLPNESEEDCAAPINEGVNDGQR